MNGIRLMKIAMGSWLVTTLLLISCGEEAGQRSGEIDTSQFGQVIEGRTHHTAVWTGSQMIVFGGFTKSSGPGTLAGSGFPGDFSTPNDVIAYDPSADQWSFIKTAGTAITGHSAVWTGTQMIVWGGVTSDLTDTTVASGTTFVTNKGTRYDPSTDIWSDVSTTGAPAARQGHTALWAEPASGQTGTAVMIVWGGMTDTSNFNIFSLNNVRNDGGRYDPARDAWTTLPTAGAPSARAGYAAVWTGKEMIIWGGAANVNNSSVDTNTGARYNVQNNLWTAMSTTNAPSARHSPVAVWTGTQVLVFGGGRLIQSGPTTRLSDGAAYDPQTDTWTPIAGFPAFTSSNLDSTSTWAGVWTGTEMIVWLDPDHAGRYDPATNTWQTFRLPTTSFAFSRFSSTTLWDGSNMLIWGGWAFGGDANGNISNNILYNTGFKFNPGAGTTTRTSIFMK